MTVVPGSYCRLDLPAARGVGVLARTWHADRAVAQRMMREIVDGWGSGIDVELGGIFGSGVGLDNPWLSWGERSNVTTVERRHPSGVGAWNCYAPGIVNADFTQEKWDAMARRAALVGGWIELEPAPVPRTTWQEAAEEVPAAVSRGVASVGTYVGETVRGAVGGLASGLGVGGVAVALGVGALVVVAGTAAYVVATRRAP